MRRSPVRRFVALPWALPFVLAVVYPTSALAQQEHSGAWTDLPEESSSTLSVVVDTGMGIREHPHTYKLGGDYDFSINGSLLLSITGLVSFAGEGVGAHIAPGVKYLMPFEGLAFIPYGRAALAVDLLGDNVAVNHDLGLGLKLGAGLQYWFDKEFSVAPEISLTTGVVSGDGDTLNATAWDIAVSFAYRLP